MIRFACPGCSAVYSVEDAKAGKTGKCPKCQAQFVIPAPAEQGGGGKGEGGQRPPPVPPSPLPPPPPQDPNAPVEIAPCPTCQARLSVTAADLGADVECPYCKTVYTARRPGERGSGRSPDLPARDDDRPSRRPRDDDDEDDRPKRRRRDDDDDEDDRPSRRRPPRDEDDDDRPSRRQRDDDDEEDDRPRRRRRDEDDRPRRRRSSGGRRREQAEAAVAVPSILLMITGGLGIALGLLNLVLVLGGFTGDPAKQNTPGYQVGQFVGATVGPLLSVAILFGGYKMRRLENYTSVIVASVLAILPCYLCCLWGMVGGIWSLVVLNRDDVKSQFD